MGGASAASESRESLTYTLWLPSDLARRVYTLRLSLSLDLVRTSQGLRFPGRMIALSFPTRGRALSGCRD